MANDSVRAIYEMTRSAIRARDIMKQAAAQGHSAAYHRAIREAPEVRYVAPLLAVRRQIGTLAAERKRIVASNAHPDQASMHIGQLDQAISQIAEGTLQWVNDRLSGKPE